MKNLLKSVICGTCDSARVHCSQLISQLLRAEPERETQITKRKRHFKLNPNG